MEVGLDEDICHQEKNSDVQQKVQPVRQRFHFVFVRNIFICRTVVVRHGTEIRLCGSEFAPEAQLWIRLVLVSQTCTGCGDAADLCQNERLQRQGLPFRELISKKQNGEVVF